MTTFKEKTKSFLNGAKNKIIIVSKGEANFYSMLYLWGLIPALVIIFLLQNKIDSIKNNIVLFIIYLIITLYFLWHLFVIRKTLKVQPQYKKVKISNKELFKGKTKEEIKEIKKEKRKERFRKLILLEGWNSAPSYIIITCIDAYVALTQMQGIFIILK